ncbi:gamma-mobile-trio integrase GmtZ [Pseudoalteromonas fuliginea]|uniref:gamma-mobile-trio integrase GmtZ n=1 Tax=Pseudoalteromonas fuliginea TaxID=1872678 RepID=UPI00317E1436
MKSTKYKTLLEAKKATKLLGITSIREYSMRYKEDSKLPSQPYKKYSKEWPKENGWTFYLGKTIKVLCPTFDEAKQLVGLLNIKSRAEYYKRYKESNKLPSQPQSYYFKDWPAKNGWHIFLGKSFKELYPTLAAAKKATSNLGINSNSEYIKRFEEDPKLPSCPSQVYSKEWPVKNGWTLFFGKTVNDFYPTLKETTEVVRLLGVKNINEYRKRYKENPKLPSDPKNYYSKEWPIKNGWFVFFGKENVEFYSTLSEAKKRVSELSINTYHEYKARYKEEPKLPSCPEHFYRKEWPTKNGWHYFLGKQVKILYTSLDEARNAALLLGIASRKEYRARYKEDQRLPANPQQVYAETWPITNGWNAFFGHRVKSFYSNLEKAQGAVFSLGIASLKEYKNRYKEDFKLPSNPKKIYFKDWVKFDSDLEFFIPLKIDNFSLLLQAVKALNINNSSEYREVRKKYKQLPSNPKRSFPNEFIDWYNLCGIAKPYPYLTLQRLVKINKVTTIDKYQKWRSLSKDSRIPSNPHESSYYKSDWVNWYVFFGVEEPFQPQYIHEPYISWRNEINIYMKSARGGMTKKTMLCKFVRLYIQKYQLGIKPIDFVLKKEINSLEFKEFISQQEGYQAKTYNVIDEFVDYIIRTQCSDEDSDTGEVIRMPNAKNRIKDTFIIDEQRKDTLGETIKPALSYQYIEAIRNWTIPSNAKTFNDLKHLHTFDADWVKVPIDIVDKHDPDCVFEVIDNNFAKIWIPMYWMHTYSLFSVPLRGIQIAYNDSGEADTYIPEYIKEKIVWVQNKNKLAGRTNNQGMIKRYPNNEFGMYSTSNKTSMNSMGSSVPWMPIELAYWLIKLRKWQSKYNPIKEPKDWIDCKRTNINEVQRKKKGRNCFLFRDYGEEECGTFGARLANRLAAALYFSQPKGIKLAICEGKQTAISMFKSEFTPHSMRVSLITIYVMEYNLDLSIIMKIAGHSSILMSVYYVKTQGSVLRKKIEEGEKRALKSQAIATQSMIEQLRIDEIKPNLIGNSQETLNALNNNIPAGNYLFRDWGICPHAGTRCEDGGTFIGNTQARSPVPIGYLGGENCIRCRHFITGPAFIGGLLAIFQEIILYLEAKQLHYDGLIEDENELSMSLEKEDEKEYLCNKNNKTFDTTKRREILASIRKTKSEYEVVAKKMDMLYCDLGALSTLVHQCQVLLNQSNLSIDNDDLNLQLIVRPEHELQVIAEEVSQYELLCEVCENAEIYQSASADLAITPRTQLIDNMMLRNNLKPLLFTLTKKQQLKAGNQLHKLFKERLKSHVKVNDLIEGKLLLSDLEEYERIEPIDLLNVLHQKKIEIKEV